MNRRGGGERGGGKKVRKKGGGEGKTSGRGEGGQKWGEKDQEETIKLKRELANFSIRSITKPLLDSTTNFNDGEIKYSFR